MLCLLATDCNGAKKALALQDFNVYYPTPKDRIEPTAYKGEVICTYIDTAKKFFRIFLPSGVRIDSG